MPNVLVDKHHAGLFHSMQRLFEDRLGMTVYTPIGMGWWDNEVWEFGFDPYRDDRLARQFLMDDGLASGEGYDPHYPDRLIRGVTFAQAADMPWDYVVATVQGNQHGFARFAEVKGAKFVMQIGNINQDVDWRLDPYALVSTSAVVQGRGVIIHQEFDSDGLFAYSPPGRHPVVVSSFVNCFGSTPCIQWFKETRLALPGAYFFEHGIDGPDGNVTAINEIATMMRGSTFGWHDKVQGDGFGHVIHMWAAIGRPLIGHGSHYDGTMAEVFWQDGVTCIDLDLHDTAETVALIREITADPDRYEAMCKAIRATFDTYVNYEAEAASVREFLGA